MEKQVLESPFVKKEFLQIVSKVSNSYDKKFMGYAIVKNSIVNIGDREFVDYRPNLHVKSNTIKENNISSISLNSLHYFQIQNLLSTLNFESVIVKKSDISVNLILANTYKEYLQNLTKKNRHELNRKKRKFSDQITSFKLSESKEEEIFNIFISQHRNSKGEKGKFMTSKIEDYFKSLLNSQGWKIYYTDTNEGVVSTAFCYENQLGCYLYNSSRDNKFNTINPGIVLNDLIIQRLIEKKLSFFDFLKGTERYKYDLGGKSIQLYDLKVNI